MRGENQIFERPFPHPSLLSGFNFTPEFSPSSAEGLQSAYRMFLFLLPPHILPLLQCGVPPTETVLYKFLLESLPHATVLHELL